MLDETGSWREVLKWAAGRIAHVDDMTDWMGFALLRKLCPGDPPTEPLGWHRVWLAGEALIEMSLAKVEQFDEGPELVGRVRDLLKELIAKEALRSAERAQAAVALCGLGDDRHGVGTRPRPGNKARPDLAWSHVIGPDEFIMGGTADFEGKRQFTHRIHHPFCIAKYPVTVAQYELFIQDSGYERRDLWTASGQEWRERLRRKRPADFDPVFQTANHPRVGISWYEVVAFCNWLNAAFTPDELKLPGEKWKVRLPTEVEWERAARHTDGRIYPWGNDKVEMTERCNVGETGIGQTTAAGLFPRGLAECGAADMAGNVWEWTRSLWGKDWEKPSYGYPYTKEDGREEVEAPSEVFRVLRGGSWDYHAEGARSGRRRRNRPGNRVGYVGFRVVVSPFDSGG